MQAPLPIPPGTVMEAKQNIAVRHLAQLADLSLTRGDSEPPNMEGLPTFDELKQWSEENAAQIHKAVKNRGFGGPDGSPLQWDNAFLGFMQAATTYLRDGNKVKDAAEAYKNNDFENAFKCLEESTAQIGKIASLWGMKFQMLCDFTENAVSGWNGPYCGAFYSEDSNAPFVTVASKGINPANQKDDWVDVHATSVQAAEGNLYNTQVSDSVYSGIFGQYEPAPAIDLIRQGLNDLSPNIPNKGVPVIVHSVGHSLGGSYSSLCYTQFTIPGVLPQFTTLGDLYTFGAPRTGYADFAEAVRDHLGPHTGSSWRIVNRGDLITQVPPKLPWESNGIFNHLDRGYYITPSDSPVAIPSEIGTTTKGPDVWPPSKITFSPHYATSYYESIQKAMSS